jgi:hypothetical protein
MCETPVNPRQDDNLPQARSLREGHRTTLPGRFNLIMRVAIIFFRRAGVPFHLAAHQRATNT